MPALPTIQVETMLLGWQRSHNGGSKIVLQVPDEDLVHFEKMTVRKGKIAGQRLAAVFVQIGDDEQPVQQPATLEDAKKQARAAGNEKKDPLGALSKWAVMRCQEPLFQEWVIANFEDQASIATIQLDNDDEEQVVKRVICNVCGINSRKELDTNDEARRIFDEKFRHPFAEASHG
jgi:hypothetical protein